VPSEARQEDIHVLRSFLHSPHNRPFEKEVRVDSCGDVDIGNADLGASRSVVPERPSRSEFVVDALVSTGETTGTSPSIDQSGGAS